jgi:hypothetical protein
MNKLGPRVVMHDTDSIIYTAEGGDYQIEEGDCLGDWETEDFETDNGGIVEFVAIGPKSYGLRGANGKEFFKCKGVTIKHAHGNMINFDVAIQILKEGQKVNLPQVSFDYSISDGTMIVRKFPKTLRFNKHMVKGDYDPITHKSYPFGYK